MTRRTTQLTLLLASVAMLAACTETSTITEPDQCIRAEQFQQCLASVPAGPTSTQYNDWSEVVSECRNTAYYQSLRDPSAIKPECRWRSGDRVKGGE